MTPLSDQLLSKLACPKCQGDLKYDRAKEVLDCMNCKLRFQVTDEIPVLLLDEATELE
jgi:hypothetical protein